MTVDISAAIDAYAHSFGNRIEPLRALCMGDAILATTLAARITELQNGIFDLVWAQSEPSGLSAADMERLARDDLAGSSPEVNEVGVRGLLRYVSWLA